MHKGTGSLYKFLRSAYSRSLSYTITLSSPRLDTAMENASGAHFRGLRPDSPASSPRSPFSSLSAPSGDHAVSKQPFVIGISALWRTQENANSNLNIYFGFLMNLCFVCLRTDLCVLFGDFWSFEIEYAALRIHLLFG